MKPDCCCWFQFDFINETEFNSAIELSWINQKSNESTKAAMASLIEVKSTSIFKISQT